MKKQVFYCVAMSVLFLLFGKTLASAQSRESLITVQVPFEFEAAGKLLPAGKYTIKRDLQNPQILSIESSAHKIFVVVNSFPLTPRREQSRASLTFKEYEEKHFLSEVKYPGYGLGYALIESKAEHKLAQAVKAKMDGNVVND